MAKNVIGRLAQWQLGAVIGSGDAGEVLKVTSEGGMQGVMKRPLQNASGGTILRQAMQIETEGQTLAKLAGLDKRRNNITVHTPILLDESRAGTSRTSHLFIVSEEVSGQAISSLLAAFHRGGPPLSQVLVVRVLAGMLQVLALAHEKGVLWNDVKMDHIFWDPGAKKLSFIDWGNSLAFDPASAAPEKANPTLDYQQMLAEGRLLMEQTAPELILELAWPLSVRELNPSELTSLRFRVEFMESYLSMRVIEYQLLMKKYLNKIDNHATLSELLDLTDALKRMGVGVDHPAILEKAAELASSTIAAGGYAQGLELMELILTRLPEHAGKPWTLAHYTLGLPLIQSQEQGGHLVQQILAANWAEAVWALQQIQDHPETVHDLRPLLQALRSASLAQPDLSATVEHLMAQTASELEQWLVLSAQDANIPETAQGQINIALENLKQIMASWASLEPGETLGQSLLQLREWTAQGHGSVAPTLPALKLTLTQLLTRLREVHRTWQENDLEALTAKLKETFLAEPALGYLPGIAAWASEIETWMESFKRGPQGQQTVTQFAQEMIDTFPPGENHLGVPNWLQGSWMAVHTIRKAQDIEVLRQQAATWPTPWLALTSARLDLPLELAQKTSLSAQDQELSQAYFKALQTNTPVAPYLAKIQNKLPAFHALYRELAAAFDQAFAAFDHPAPLFDPQAFPATERDKVQEALQVLSLISTWKEAQRQGLLQPTNAAPELLNRWATLQNTEKTNQIWQKKVLPILTAIRQRLWDQLPDPEGPVPKDALGKVAVSLARLSQAWGKVPEQGLYAAQVNEMLADADSAQEAFLRFWQEAEHDSGQVMAWLVRANQSFLSGINHQLLSLSRQLRVVLRSLEVINTPQMARTRLARNSAGDLIFALVQTENLLKPPSRKTSRIREWQQQYLDLLKETERNAIQRKIMAIESIHPLLPWFDELARRDADYFQNPKPQRW